MSVVGVRGWLFSKPLAYISRIGWRVFDVSLT